MSRSLPVKSARLANLLRKRACPQPTSSAFLGAPCYSHRSLKWFYREDIDPISSSETPCTTAESIGDRRRWNGGPPEISPKNLFEPELTHSRSDALIRGSCTKKYWLSQCEFAFKRARDRHAFRPLWARNRRFERNSTQSVGLNERSLLLRVRCSMRG